MKAAIVVAALAAPVAFASPLQVRHTAEKETNELPTPPTLIGWAGHIIKRWWGEVGLRRSAAPQGLGSLFGGSGNSFGSPGNPAYNGPGFSVAVTVTTETLTAAVPTNTVPTTTVSASPTSATASGTASGTSWDWAADETWEGDQPASMSYAKPVLDAHNIHRANHSVVNLKWSSTMEQTAKQISETCVYAHSRSAGNGDYGQNIGAGFPADDIAAMVGDTMYNDEIELYPGPYGEEPDMTNFESWGHYTQIVWSDTTEVGCWTTDCSGTGLQNVGSDVSPEFTVCNYYPPGNVVGEFGAKVPSPGDLPNVVIPSTD
ncbi:hypothetical protein DV736_g1422, partial [Chaetothyriales sp. CBS 134916]